MSAGCRLCGEPKQDWQVYCGAACCVAWEMGIRTKDELEAEIASATKSPAPGGGSEEGGQ